MTTIKPDLTKTVIAIYNEPVTWHDETFVGINFIIDKLFENIISFIIYNKNIVSQNLHSLNLQGYFINKLCDCYLNKLNHDMIDIHFNNMTFEECIILLKFKNINYAPDVKDLYSLIQCIFAVFITLDKGLLVQSIHFDTEIIYIEPALK